MTVPPTRFTLRQLVRISAIVVVDCSGRWPFYRPEPTGLAAIIAFIHYRQDAMLPRLRQNFWSLRCNERLKNVTVWCSFTPPPKKIIFLSRRTTPLSRTTIYQTRNRQRPRWITSWWLLEWSSWNVMPGLGCVCVGGGGSQHPPPLSIHRSYLNHKVYCYLHCWCDW